MSGQAYTGVCHYCGQGGQCHIHCPGGASGVSRYPDPSRPAHWCCQPNSTFNMGMVGNGAESSEHPRYPGPRGAVSGSNTVMHSNGGACILSAGGGGGSGGTCSVTPLEPLFWLGISQGGQIVAAGITGNIVSERPAVLEPVMAQAIPSVPDRPAIAPPPAAPPVPRFGEDGSLAGFGPAPEPRKCKGCGVEEPHPVNILPDSYSEAVGGGWVCPWCAAKAAYLPGQVTVNGQRARVYEMDEQYERLKREQQAAFADFADPRWLDGYMQGRRVSARRVFVLSLFMGLAAAFIVTGNPVLLVLSALMWLRAGILFLHRASAPRPRHPHHHAPGYPPHAHARARRRRP